MYSQAVVFPLNQYPLNIFDWAIPQPMQDFHNFLSIIANYLWKNNYVPRNLPVNRWHVNGWVPPILSVNFNSSYVQPYLWMAVLATTPVTFYYPPSGKPTLYSIEACITAPYVFLWLLIIAFLT